MQNILPDILWMSSIVWKPSSSTAATAPAGMLNVYLAEQEDDREGKHPGENGMNDKMKEWHYRREQQMGKQNEKENDKKTVKGKRVILVNSATFLGKKKKAKKRKTRIC